MDVSMASASATANTVPFIFGITFNTNETGTRTMSFTQLPEQPRTFSNTCTANTTARPARVANSVNVGELFGLSKEEYRLQHASYAGSVVSNPVNLAFAQLWFRSFDGSTTGTYDFMVRHRFQIEFFNLNSFDSTIPQLDEEKERGSSAGKWGVLGL